MYLRDINFSGGTFIGVKFGNANLTGASFQKATLQGVDLTGTILYSLDDLGHPITDKFIRLVSGDHYELVKQYSNLMNSSEFKHAECLNKLFPSLHLNLSNTNLQGADLSNVNLQNAYLWKAHLQGAVLTNANLQSAKLVVAWLQRVHLTNADLQNADLRGALLRGADLKSAKLGGAILSLEFKLPENCKDEDLVIIYKCCTDESAKRMFKQILEGKMIPLE